MKIPISVFGLTREVDEQDWIYREAFTVTFQCPKCKKETQHEISRYASAITFYCGVCEETVTVPVALQAIDFVIHGSTLSKEDLDPTIPDKSLRRSIMERKPRKPDRSVQSTVEEKWKPHSQRQR